MQGTGESKALNVEELLLRLKRKGVPLQFEIGAFVALETCEAIVERPVRVAREAVWVNERGQVAVAEEAPQDVPEEQAVSSLRDLLSDLLLAAAPGVPQDLLRLVDSEPEADEWTLKSFREALEASLIPLNRQATRRVLARLVREATFHSERASAVPLPAIKQAELDASFDRLVGYPPPETNEISRGTAGEATRRRMERPESGQPISAGPDEEPEDAHQAGSVPDHHRLSIEQFEEAGREPASLFRQVAAVVVLLFLVLVLGYSLLNDAGSGPFDCNRAVERSEPALTRADPAPPVLPSPAVEEKEPAREIARGGRLAVNSSPQGAQVLFLAGTAPLTMTGLPLRVAHEFVAVAEGRKPVRGIIPTDAAWRDTAAGPLYHLVLESRQPAEPGEQWDLGPTLLPRESGSPFGKLGTVRITTVPAGMQVYRLLGFTPDLVIENFPAGERARLLLYESGFSATTVAVGPESWVESDQGMKAEIDVSLEKP